MNNQFLYLNSRDELYRIEISKIVYFEGEGNYTNIMLCNKMKGTVSMNLAQMQLIISKRMKDKAACFARIGKRFIVNLSYVYHISVLKQKLVLSDGNSFSFQLSISKDALKSLKDIYVNTMQNEE